MIRSSILMRGLAFGVILGFAGCGEPTTLAVDEMEPSFSVEALEPSFSVAGSRPLVCPTEETRSASALIGPAGGSVELDGHEVTLPADAVRQPTEITLRIPASRYLVLNLKADGHEFVSFRKPVTVTLSYSRCQRRDLFRNGLEAWQFDPETESLMEPMPSRVDSALRVVVFTTYHFSHFALAD